MVAGAAGAGSLPAGRRFAANSSGISRVICMGAGYISPYLDCGREEHVGVVVLGGEEEFALGTIALERREEEFVVGCALEVAMLLDGRDGESVGGEFLTLGRHGEEISYC